MTVKYPAYIGVGDARVAPCGVDGDAHLILVEVCCTVMEAHNAGGGAPWDLMQAGALGGRWIGRLCIPVRGGGDVRRAGR